MKIWRRASALAVTAAVLSLFGVLGGACGGAETPCDRALDKVQQCGVTDVSLNDNGDECAEISACQANCLLKGDCGEIQDAVEGVQNSLFECAEHCG